MNNSIFIRISGWAFILAGVRFFLFILHVIPVGIGQYLQDFPFFQVVFLWIVFALGPMSMLIGLLGLRARYGDIIGSFVRNALLVGAIGDPLLVYVGWILNQGVALYITFLALAIGQLCLAIFGIAALKHKLLPRFNWLPLGASACYPVVYPLYLFVLLRIFYVYSEFSLTPAEVIDALVAAGLFAQAVAMVVLGFILQSDQPAVTDETAALS